MNIGDEYECIKYHEVGGIPIGDKVVIENMNNDYVVIKLQVVRKFATMHISQSTFPQYFKKV